MLDFETLMREHDALDELSAILTSVVRCPPDCARAASALAQLASELVEHLRKEDCEIYPQLATSRDQSAVSTAQEMMADFEALTNRWTDYVELWDEQGIGAAWSDFAAETEALMAWLRRRIARENELLYPMALRGGHIRLRAA